MSGRTTPVCVVDDDDAVRDSVRILLEAAGYDVRVFASGAAFLADASMPPDCVLLCDLHMPEMNGAQLLARARDAGFSGSAIVMTGRGDPLLEERLTRAGVLAVLAKPVTEDDLLHWIGRAAALLAP